MDKKLSLTALTALVLSSMVGAGVFSLPQNMAEVASPAALIIGWSITGVGILFLAFALLLLSRLRPDLDGGIFTYAKDGFGELIGFCSAWGYWLCAVIANVSYLVIVFAAFSFFTDTPDNIVFGDGNTWQALIGESVLLWFVHCLVLRGVQTAAGINKLATFAKLVPLGLFIVLAVIAFRWDTFHLDFTGVDLGVPVWQQVKDTMLITLWVFIGIEGAVVVSARARRRKDVGLATMMAVISALTIYILVTLLTIASEMILVPYFLVGAFLVQTALRMKKPALLGVGMIAAMYGLWLIYASGIINLMLSVVLYAPGILVFLYALKNREIKTTLHFIEWSIIAALLIAAVPALWYLVR